MVPVVLKGISLQWNPVNATTSLLRPGFYGPTVVALTGFHCREIPLSTTGTTSVDDALVSYDNFVQHKFRYLVVENKTKTKAVTSDDCIWECLTFNTCLSLNVGSVPDDGSVWCELLFTDMFTSSRSLHENTSSHHLSRWVSIFKRQYSSTDVFSFLQPVHRILHINLL